MKIAKLTTVLAFAAALLAPAAASAAPQLGSTTYWAPTQFQTGSQAKLWVNFLNRGPDAVSSGWNVKITLPPGVTYGGIVNQSETAAAVWATPWSSYCSATSLGATVINCSVPGSGLTLYPGYSSGTGFGLGSPYDPYVQVALKLDVSPSAPVGDQTLELEVSGGGSPPAIERHTIKVGPSTTPFGLDELEASALDASGNDYTVAGGHPDIARAYFRTNLQEFETSPNLRFYPAEGALRTLHVDTPPGFVGDPNAVPKCPRANFFAVRGADPALSCPTDSQVGFVIINAPIIGFVKAPIYNLTPPGNLPAQFGFTIIAGPVLLDPDVRVDGTFGLQVTVSNISQADTLLRSEVVLWGDPSNPSHDVQRCENLNSVARACVGFNEDGFSAPTSIPHAFTSPRKPFLSLPTNCFQEQRTTFYADRWNEPAPDEDLTDPRWHSFSRVSPTPTGCETLDFAPTLQARPTTKVADSPTGLEVKLHIPQNEDPEGTVTAHLRNTAVTFPEGLVLNPSAANGLAACSSSQIGLTTPAGQNPGVFDDEEPSCPAASKLANATVVTPLLEDPLSGEVFLAAPDDNPFGSDYAIYIVIRGPGILIKLAGKVTPDPQTGRLTTTFEESPQLPFSDFNLDFSGGADAPLRTPATCGAYATTSELTPWSAPDSGPPVHYSDPYTIDQGPNGSPCAASESELPNAPSFNSGALEPLAGKYSPFVLNLRREDGSQRFKSVTLTPPPGLTAKLAETPICPDSALTAAASKTGAAEQASPSCPAASQVGKAFAAAGAGPAPYWAPGKAYLAGPYKGAPLSLAFVTPATAGPFDLGTVVIRTAVYVNSKTAEITAVSDPIPHILEGIDLDIRTVSVRLDKPNFSLNPTSCDPMAVDGLLTSTLNQPARLTSRFQLAECGRLGFKPGVSLKLKGGVTRGKHPALTVTLTPRPGDANIASISIALPHSEFLENAHIRTICTRPQFAADQCPAAAIYGEASVTTPLLGYPLTGHVYLRSSDNELPDVVPDLRGPSYQPIKLETAGRTDSIRGGIRNTLDFVPDAPFTKAVVALQGGDKGLLVNSRNICDHTFHATVKYTAHNGLAYTAHPPLKANCHKGAKKAKRAKQRRGGR